MLNPNSLAASPWVISFFLVFFNATSRSLSTWVISSCPSCIPKAWGCQDDISTLLKDDILILLPQRQCWRVGARWRALAPALAGRKEVRYVCANVAAGLGFACLYIRLKPPSRVRLDCREGHRPLGCSS